VLIGDLLGVNMLRFAFRFVTLFATVLAFAQTKPAGPSGTWRVEGEGAPFPWEAVLRVAGPNLLIGAVSTRSLNSASEIIDGRIDGDTITFKFNPYDGLARMIVLTGNVSGDTITFDWKSQDPLDRPLPAADRMFGASAPPQFLARRVADANDAISRAAELARKPPEVTFDRILHADQEPQNWLTFSGTLSGLRYSPLTQITAANIKNLELAWIWQAQSPMKFEATSIVVDGVLYTVQAPNDVVALDAATGRIIWTYSYVPKRYRPGYRVNRGLAILGNTLFLGTLDSHLIAIDAYSGKQIWNVTVADSSDPSCQDKTCYSITSAPLIVKDKVIVGISGGDGLVRGFFAAFDVRTGNEAWRFWTIPRPGEPGSETWATDAWKTGGGAVWNTGSYDPDLNLTYWGTGNPHPEFPNTDPGDNLYTESVVALDADTGRLKWHYQFTPHDEWDWDSTQTPVLRDLEWRGRTRKVMLWANRNGLFYVLDRTTGEFLLGKPFVEVNWMNGFDAKGRPMRVVQTESSIRPGSGELGATNWYPSSYSPNTRLLYVSVWESYANPRFAAMRALDPQTGERKWDFKKENAIFKSGALTTASDVLFTGVLGQGAAGAAVDGEFYALDARTGQLLWQRTLPGSVEGSPMSYSVANKQYIAVAAGNTLFAFALR
jgi:alcohol dehydrogenase (cytochrome c)